jgi:uncharacterized membrane protein YoaK (UPF0700 family)
MRESSLTPAKPQDPLPTTLVALTATTGLVDAVSVLGLGSVFVANMTGNVVFLGFAVAGAPGFSIPRSLVALAAFLAGAVLGGRLSKSMATFSRRRQLVTVSAIEAGCFFIAAVIARGYDPKTFAPSAALYVLIVLTAVAMGVRNATVRRLAVPDVTTTVLTLTLTGIAAESMLAGGDNPRLARRVGSVILMFVGAAVGAVLVTRRGLALPLVVAGASVVLITLAYVAHPGSRTVGGR